MGGLLSRGSWRSVGLVQLLTAVACVQQRRQQFYSHLQAQQVFDIFGLIITSTATAKIPTAK